VHFDLAAVKADRDQRFDQRLLILEARRAFNVMTHGFFSCTRVD
jgi:hypothetical protein